MNWDRAYGIEVGGVRETDSGVLLDDSAPTQFAVFLRFPVKGLVLVKQFASEAEAVLAAAELQKTEKITLTNRLALARFYARKHKSVCSYA